MFENKLVSKDLSFFLLFSFGKEIIRVSVLIKFLYDNTNFSVSVKFL